MEATSPPMAECWLFKKLEERTEIVRRFAACFTDYLYPISGY